MGRTDQSDPDVVVVDIGRMVHGGHALAFLEDHTILVRYAIPGERVRARITRRNARVWFADAIEIVVRDPRRRAPVCPDAVPGGCGGCDWQFAPLDMQRSWKADVLAESFRRFAPDVRAPQVPVQGLDEHGLGWRTRATWHLDARGRAGYLVHGGSTVVVPQTCAVLTPELDGARRDVGLTTSTGPAAKPGDRGGTADTQRAGSRRLTGQHGAQDQVAIGSGNVRRDVRGRRWRIPAESFWQAHERLPRVLVEAVLAAGAPADGETWWDLFSGAGLFSAFIADAVGRTGGVHAVEAQDASVRAARRALHDQPVVRLHHARVEDWLASWPAAQGRPSGIVVDPPRTGLGALVPQVAAAGARVIVYVACDPVALARDAHALAGLGYAMTTLAAFDAFPMTHHMECIASFVNEIS